MESELKAVITGATSGIGYELTKILCREHGARIVGVGRNRDKLNEVKRELGECFQPMALDLSRFESVNELYREAEVSLGEVDLLVNNAGFGLYKKITEHTAEELASLITVNFTTPLLLTIKMLPLMKKNSTVVFVITAGVHVLMQSLPVYGASKAGLHYAVKALRRELSERGVNVLAVYPGVVKTSFHSRAGSEIGEGLDPGKVAREIIRAIEGKKKELYVPRYLSLAKVLTLILPPFRGPAKETGS
jgi:short-subunit dehydrogenase